MPHIRVTASFCRQTRIHPFAGLCQHTHKSFLAAKPEQLETFVSTNLPSKPSCTALCMAEGKAALGQLLRFAPQALRPHQLGQEHTHKCLRDATLGPPASLQWSYCCLNRVETRGSALSFYCLSVGKAPTCPDVGLCVSRTVHFLFAPFPAASFIQALALISAGCCELLLLCEVSWRMGYPRHEFTDDF